MAPARRRGEPGPTARSSRGRWPAVIAGRSVRPRTAEAEGFSSNGKPKSGGTTDPRPDTGRGSFVLPRGGETRGEHGGGADPAGADRPRAPGRPRDAGVGLREAAPPRWRVPARERRGRRAHGPLLVHRGRV